MALADVELQILIAQKVGDVDPTTGDPVAPTRQGATGVVMGTIATLWARHADKLPLSPELRDLYVQLDAIDLVIGVLERQVNIVIDGQDNHTIRLNLSDRLKTKQNQRKAVTDRMDAVLASVGAGSGSVRPLTTTEIIEPPTFGSTPFPNGRLDANSEVYRGSPYWRRFRRRG